MTGPTSLTPTASPRADQFSAAPVRPPLFPDRVVRRGLFGRIGRDTAFVVGIGLIVVIVGGAVFAPLLTPHDPMMISPTARLRPFSTDHLFGTDRLGRDLFARVVYGARISLFVGVSVAFLAALIGLFIGLVSGYVRALDGLIMRSMDALMSIPGILLAIAMMALFGSSVSNVIISITLVEIPRVARLVRGVVLSLREQVFVEAAVTSGNSSSRIILRHILPNTMAPLIVQASYVCASAMLTESILSFIGAGVPVTVPSWGNVMADGRALWQIRPSMIFVPAVALSLTILAINLVGDSLRDHLDPRLNRKI
ncbi:ABC transporter permease [Hoeflea alexandrii]|uniref:ABC transporter permease n=1 Tax=Hoeflea alexandrii TaxID=288436 RepID=UPI003D2F7FDD